MSSCICSLKFFKNLDIFYKTFDLYYKGKKTTYFGSGLL